MDVARLHRFPPWAAGSRIVTIAHRRTGERSHGSWSSLGVHAMKRIDEGDIEVHLEALDAGGYAVLFLNRGDAARDDAFDWAFHDMKDDIAGREIDVARQRFDWRDEWNGGTGSTAEAFSATIPAHGVVVLRLAPQ